MPTVNKVETRPRYPVLRCVTLEQCTFFDVAATPHELCRVRKLELPHFKAMRLVDVEGDVWRPRVLSQRVVNRIWWKIGDWLDPVIEVSLKVDCVGGVCADELRNSIVSSIDQCPAVYKTSLEWYDAVAAVKHADTVDAIIAAMHAWLPRELPP